MDRSSAVGSVGSVGFAALRGPSGPGGAWAGGARGGSGASARRDGADPMEAARSFVATALIQPVLKELRATNGAAEPFAPGAHEKQFAPLMDQLLSERLTRASSWPLVDAVAQRLRDASGGPAPRAELNDEGGEARARLREQIGVRELVSRRGWLG